MDFLSRERVREMLALQNSLNCVVNPDWRNAGYAWHRAAYQEVSEAINEIPWKWWKKGETNLPRLQMELVDTWHFDMSMRLVRASNVWRDNLGNAQSDDVIVNLACSELMTEGDLRAVLVEIDSDFISLASLSLLDSLESMLVLYGLKRTDLPLFSRTLELAGMTWDDLYCGYIAKNVLNEFRQVHGYKAGTYKKSWNGRDDGDVLFELAGKLKDAPDFSVQLRAALEAEYARLG